MTSRRRDRRTRAQQTTNQERPFDLRSTITKSVTTINNLVIDSEERISQLIELLLNKGHLVSRNDITRLKKRIASLREAILDLEDEINAKEK